MFVLQLLKKFFGHAISAKWRSGIEFQLTRWSDFGKKNGVRVHSQVVGNPTAVAAAEKEGKKGDEVSELKRKWFSVLLCCVCVKKT